MKNYDKTRDKWIREIIGPCSVHPKMVNTTARKEFTEHFGLTWTFNGTPTEFWNLKNFMKGSKYYNSGGTLQRVYPESLHGSFDHLSAYKDDNSHVLIVSQPYGFNRENVATHLLEMGWCAAIFDKSRAFYANNTDIFVFATKETFSYFLDNRFFDGWAVEILPKTEVGLSEN